MPDLNEILYGTPAPPVPPPVQPAMAYSVQPPPVIPAATMPPIPAAQAYPVAAPVPPQEQAIPPLPQGTQPAPGGGAAQGGAPGGGGEMSWMDKIRTNPNLMQAALMTGLTLMQGNREGENLAGLAGRSLMVGTTAKGYLDENQRAAELQAREESRKEAESTSRIEMQGAQTAQAKQETAQKAAMFPETQRKLKVEIDNLVAKGELDKANLLKAQFENDPAHLAEVWNLDKKVKQAQIGASQAAAGASAASAEASRALTRERGLENDALTILADPNATPEARERSALVLQKGKTPKSEHQSQVDMYTVLQKKIHPEWDEQKIAQEVSNVMLNAKMNPVQMAQKVIENRDLYGQDAVDNALSVIAAELKNQADRARGKGGETPPPGAGAAKPSAVATGGGGAPPKPAPLPPKEALVVGQVYPGYGTWSGTGFR